VLPLRDVVVFPHVVMPLVVGRAASLAALEQAGAGDGRLLLVAQRDADTDEPRGPDLHRTGVVARIHQLARTPQGNARVLLEGTERVRVTRYAAQGDALQGTVTPLPFGALPEGADGQLAARRAVAGFEEYVSLHRRLPAEILQLVQGGDDPLRQACVIAAHLSIGTEARQALLEAPSLGALFEALARTLAGEVELLRLERKIEDDVRGSLFRNQREFFLQEQLRAIHRELGNEDGDETADLEAQLQAAQLPEAVLQRARREVRRLRKMQPMSPEATVARGFLDWVLALPWHQRSDDVLDVAHAREVLDADHFGLEEVKDRILDHIAVLRQVGRLDGPVLCLAGPPGVGKTSLARSIARALGRRFVRMSLGGVRDEAEIRGHRRTYIGAMPGRILQAMRKAGSVNPVVLLDEIDKLGHDWRGDPSAALLEVLDPEQHAAFSDHYLEVDYDLSQVMFVTTANQLSGIPEPLRDRMEIIRIPGYLDHEKLAIAEKYLVPRTLAAVGIDTTEVTWEPRALAAVLRGWTREAGVRDLERRLARIARKLARRRAEATGAPPALHVAVAELPALLGPRPFDDDDTSLDDKVGVATGLAYTAVGGETLEIEVSVVEGRGRLQLTGTLGDVMKESANAAMSYARARAGTLGIPADFHRGKDVHVHIPAGATPKDGPSAGIAIATALVSALTGVPVRGDVAMTGEITLRGRVLPIGGLKEKAVGAHRAGITHVLVPRANEREIDELPADVRAAVTFHPVATMDDVLALGLRAAKGPPAAVPVPAVPPTRRRRPATTATVPVVPPPAPRRAPAAEAAPATRRRAPRPTS
jgi:ATP-dependent Lon protease